MQSKKPTREQRKVIKKLGLDTYVWMVQKDSSEFLQIVNKDTGEVKQIMK